jgi:hypothetical protein
MNSAFMKTLLPQHRVRFQKKFFFVGLLLGLPFLSGCLLGPDIDKRTLAVRLGSNSNIVERLVIKDTGLAEYNLIQWEGSGPITICEKQTYYLERAGHRRVKIDFLPGLKEETKKTYPWLDWHFWPVPGTNLWVAIDSGSVRDIKITNGWEKDVDLKVYLFNFKAAVRQKQLTTFVPDKYNGGYPDFRFDPLYRHNTYKTRNGYETYSMLEDTIVPSGEPSGEPALPVERNGAFIKHYGDGFDWPLKPDPKPPKN